MDEPGAEDKGSAFYQKVMAQPRPPETWRDKLLEVGLVILLVGAGLTKVLSLGIDRRYRTGFRRNGAPPFLIAIGPVLMLAGIAMLYAWCAVLK